MIVRTEGWESRLPAALATVRGWTYEQGTRDCITMVCHFIAAVTGVDLWPLWAGRYHDPRGALLLIARMAESRKPYLTNAVSNVLGVPPWPPLLARRGDVVEFGDESDPHLGVCLGVQVVGFGPQGVYFVPLKECRHCWRVG